MTATIARPKSKKPTASKQESPYKRFHVIIPIKDMLWVSQQKSSVTQLWQECWTADPYGSRWMPLSTGLGYSTFIAAKKVLSDSGLFIFKPDKSIQDGRETVGWMIRNLHGSRMKEFWEQIDSASQEPDSKKQEPNSSNTEMDAAPGEIGALYRASISEQSQSEQGLQESSRTTQKLLTNSSKEIVRSDSSTSYENTRVEATADAPFGGASPQTLESVEEEKELPQVTDCTSLALVDVAPSQSASLLKNNQDLGDEQGVSHEDHLSAAPQIEMVTSLDKWSPEAIVQRRELRPRREIKFKLCGMTGENPGFEFLAECWEDVALWNKIKQLITRYPQWGIVFADGGIHLMESIR